MHIAQLNNKLCLNSLYEESKSEIEFQLKGKLLSQLHVSTLYQSNLSFNLTLPQAYPSHLTPLLSWGGANLIINQPFKLLATQLHVNNQSFSLSVKKTIQSISLVS